MPESTLSKTKAETPYVLESGGTEVTTTAGGGRRYRKPLRSFRWHDVQSVLSDSLTEWSKHNAPRLGASLAFYTLLSLTPLLLVAVSGAALVVGQHAAENQLIAQIYDLVGPQGAKAIEALLDGSRNTAHGVVATVLGLVTLLFGASAVLVELRDALNTIWEVTPQTRKGLQNLIDLAKERLFSFGLVLSVGFLLLVSLAVSAWISALGALSAAILPASAAALHIINVVVSFLIITGLFAAIYKVIPDARIEWHDVLLGAVVTSVLFTVGKLLIGLYLGRASFASSYGAAGSIVVLIVWVYYSSQIFFLGAEFTRAFANRYGSEPSRHPEGMVVEANVGASESPTKGAIIISP
jgi:membrane protein